MHKNSQVACLIDMVGTRILKLVSFHAAILLKVTAMSDFNCRVLLMHMCRNTGGAKAIAGSRHYMNEVENEAEVHIV